MLQIEKISLIVRDYDEAITYYTQKLDFELLEDTPLDKTKRWVVVRPKNSDGASLLLAKAANEHQLGAIGNQTGGRVFLFLHSDNFEKDYRRMLNHGVEFVEIPRKEAYGTVVVFKDLYGNLWDLIGP
ncbi:MAG: VOC family protein [Flavobacteriales bacterium]|nr:MAG: VOC family protein [Flavobacteriales bacterium]